MWDLPSVDGNYFARSVLSGWRLNSIVKVGNGRPFAATVTGEQGGDINGDGARGDSSPVFARGTFIGPGYASVDLSLHKVFSREGKTLELGFEAYNLFNRANYLRPVTDYFALTNVPGGISRLEGPLPSFGKPQDATRSRETQVFLRILFLTATFVHHTRQKGLTRTGATRSFQPRMTPITRMARIKKALNFTLA